MQLVSYLQPQQLGTAGRQLQDVGGCGARNCTHQHQPLQFRGLDSCRRNRFAIGVIIVFLIFIAEWEWVAFFPEESDEPQATFQHSLDAFKRREVPTFPLGSSIFWKPMYRSSSCGHDRVRTSRYLPYKPWHSLIERTVRLGRLRASVCVWESNVHLMTLTSVRRGRRVLRSANRSN